MKVVFLQLVWLALVGSWILSPCQPLKWYHQESKIDGSFAKARANEIRCFWPPDKPTPRSPTIVS